MPVSRWKFVYGVAACAAHFDQRVVSAQTEPSQPGAIVPIKPGPEVDAFTVAQNKLLEKFDAVSLEVTHADRNLRTTRTGRGDSAPAGMEGIHEKTYNFEPQGNNLHAVARRFGYFFRR